MMRYRADIVWVCHAILHEPQLRVVELAVRLFEPAREIGECLVALGAAAFLIDDREESLDRAAAILRELAADEVHRLHAVRAFIDHRDARIPDILAHRSEKRRGGKGCVSTFICWGSPYP